MSQVWAQALLLELSRLVSNQEGSHVGMPESLHETVDVHGVDHRQEIRSIIKPVFPAFRNSRVGSFRAVLDKSARGKQIVDSMVNVKQNPGDSKNIE